MSMCRELTELTDAAWREGGRCWSFDHWHHWHQDNFIFTSALYTEFIFIIVFHINCISIKMAMAKYLNSAKKYTTPLELGLPDPNKEATPEKARICEAANTCILSPRGSKRKRGAYIPYTPESRYDIGKYGAEHGPAKAARHFTHVSI
jgi:hypothetical protein